MMSGLARTALRVVIYRGSGGLARMVQSARRDMRAEIKTSGAVPASRPLRRHHAETLIVPRTLIRDAYRAEIALRTHGERRLLTSTSGSIGREAGQSMGS